LSTFVFKFTHEYLNGAEGILMLCFSGYYYYQLQSETQDENISANAFFWINSGVFLYFGTSFFVLLFENNLRYQEEFIRILSWSIHHTSNIAHNILFSFGIWKIKGK
jgi:hypothetical protein